ncbi:MAG: PQQ-dependent sugar dehydrogenase [Gammaproteobacteria bacterium]
MNPSSRRRLLAAALLSVTALPLIASASDDRKRHAVQEMDGLRVVTVATGLSFPWGMAFLPGGDMLVTERSGGLRRVGSDGTVSPPLGGLPVARVRGQGGLLDIALDPGFADNRLVYLSYAEAGPGDTSGLAVARGALRADETALDNVQVIFRQHPKVDSDGHFGGRMVFSKDGHLFITLGDRQRDRERDKAQQLDKHHGKIVRILPDGRIPADNPFVKTAGARPEIWSLGHRNPQGAALHPVTGELWASEHGPQGGDEINIVRRGRNYGWPVVTYGCEYVTCFSVGEGSKKPGMEAPITWWVPRSIAPSGLAFYTGNRHPAWTGQLFSGALAGQALWRLKLDGNRVIERQPLLTQLGERIRDVRQGPDGWLYLLTDSGRGRVLRVER